jgi:hypothetical protein
VALKHCRMHRSKSMELIHLHSYYYCGHPTPRLPSPNTPEDLAKHAMNYNN